MSESPKYATIRIDELDNLPEPSWLVEGLVPADSFVTLFGAPGSTKSMWALDVSLSIAAGRKFHHREVSRGKVMYFIGEGLRGIRWRIQAWKAAHPDHDEERLQENLILIPQAPKLLEPYEQKMLLSTVEDEENLKLIVVDTWARSLAGGDENSAGDTTTGIELLESVRKATGATPMVIHHTGADGQRERGSTALRGSTDASLRMTRDEGQNLSTLSCQKLKDGTAFKPITYKTVNFGPSVVLKETEGYVSPPKSYSGRSNVYTPF